MLLCGIYAPCAVLASRLARGSCGATAAERGGRYPQDFMPHEAADVRLTILRHPDLRRYLSARFIVSVATQVRTVAVGWQVFSVSGNPMDLGLVALGSALPPTCGGSTVSRSR